MLYRLFVTFAPEGQVGPHSSCPPPPSPSQARSSYFICYKWLGTTNTRVSRYWPCWRGVKCVNSITRTHLVFLECHRVKAALIPWRPCLERASPNNCYFGIISLHSDYTMGCYRNKFPLFIICVKLCNEYRDYLYIFVMYVSYIHDKKNVGL